MFATGTVHTVMSGFNLDIRAKLIIVETWGGGGGIWHGQEWDVAVYYVDDIQNHQMIVSV